MRIELLFGFLGSGKTTLARRILDEWGKREKLALIVNEFGDVGVDGAILEGNGIEMIEMSSGCLCCTLKGSLLNGIEELAKDKSLDHIIIEATGVAEPELMIETFSDPSFHETYEVGPITTVVDVAKFSKIRSMLGPFYEEQVAQADLIVLNKIDITDTATIDTAIAEIRELNEVATIRLAEHGDIDIAEIMHGPPSGLVEQSAANHDKKEDHHHHHHDHDHDHHHDALHAPAESFVLEMPASIPSQQLESFFANAPERLWRSKGFAIVDGKPSLIQYTLSGLEITKASARDRYYLVFIGDELDRDALSAGLEAMAAEASAS